MSVSLATVTLHNVIIPLLPSFCTEDLHTVKVEHCWMTGNGANTVDHSSKMYLPTCDDPSNKELLLYVINQFLNAAHNDRLHLSTGALHYSKFQDIIGGNLRIIWQEISDAQGAKTVDSLMEDMDVLVGCYLAPTAYQDQLEYLLTATKQFQMSCEQLGSCLRVISHLGHYLPGSTVAGIRFNLFATNDVVKRAYFSLMPAAWKIKFAESGQILNNIAYEYQNLVWFMAIQEALSKRSHGDQSSKWKAPGYSGGHGTGGRGRGGHGNCQYCGGGSCYSSCYQSCGGHGGNYYAPNPS